MDSEVRSWRKCTRQRLIELRLQQPAVIRRQWSEAICNALNAQLSLARGMVVGFCWPYKGEPDVLPSIRRWLTEGVIAALPEVEVEKGPLSFRRWSPGVEMKLGVYDIPVPANTQRVCPEVLIAPVVGFDDEGYRLGYGGGYFDRTLANAQPTPRLIGVGFEMSRLDTIYPQKHDHPMTAIVTESGYYDFPRKYPG